MSRRRRRFFECSTSNNRRVSWKRKFGDNGSSSENDDGYDEDDLDSMASILFALSQDEPYSGDGNTTNTAIATSSAARVPFLQFFVRRMDDGNDIVIRAKPGDTVGSIHQRLYWITGIPERVQRLKYKGKQLKWKKTLVECSIENDVSVQLIGRMHSTKYSQAWRICHNMVSVMLRLCRGEIIQKCCEIIKNMLTEFFLSVISEDSKDDSGSVNGHLQTFMASSVIDVLVMLYMSPITGNKECAHISISHFLELSHALPTQLQKHCAPVLLEFCKLLRRTSLEDPLYLSCRRTFGSLVETIGVSQMLIKSKNSKRVIVIPDLYPFVRELATKLSKDLASSMKSPMGVGPLLSDVHEFTAYSLPLRNAIIEHVDSYPISLRLYERDYDKNPFYNLPIMLLHNIFLELLKVVEPCLHNIEDCLYAKGSGEGGIVRSGWSQYLAILKELNSISKLYRGAEQKLWTVLSLRKSAVCALIIRYTKRTDDYHWLLEHKEDVTDFKSRRHLAMMMLPKVEIDNEELYEMLIDRSQLLVESFAYIAYAEPKALQAGLCVGFKNEVARGNGVLREWLFLVCKALFNPQTGLFVPCPNDRRRFYPNFASKDEPLNCDYYRFSGRVIALALMHKVQVGIVFDCTFFLQLAGMHVSLEDIKDADPCMYNSCKQILDMDDDLIDSDVLGLTFVREVDELGSRGVEELCPGGKTIIVDSNNRVAYVNLLIEHCFVSSISEQVSHFARGFSDVLRKNSEHHKFFQCLELEDLDWMLHGNDHSICVEDWKAHTDYNGYRETDIQVIWFWKIVELMSAEQKKALLFFWTSVKHLPVEGFSGLASPLCIIKSFEPSNRLPSSHTCFYQLCFPAYPSMSEMQDRLRIITQEHIGCSFGTS